MIYPTTRRRFLGGAGALGLTALTGPTYCATGAGVNAAEVTPTLDLTNKEDALTAMVKMRGSLEAVDVPHWYYGIIYAVLPGKAAFPLVEFEGSEIDYYERQADGSYKAYGATVSYFKDVRTREVLQTWTNPITEQVVEVQPNTINVKAHYIYTPNGFKRSDDPRPIPEDGSITDSLKWTENGPMVWMQMNRPYPEGVPLAEHQEVSGPLAELHDPNMDRVNAYGAPVYISPYLSWMKMDGVEGHTVWAGPARKLHRVEEYPKDMLARMERDYPHKLTAKPG